MAVKKKKSAQRRQAMDANQSAPFPRRRGTKEATEEKLVAAAIELLHQCGVAAVSSVSVTKAAGFTQSSFYRHFANVEACLQAAAEKVAAEIRASAAEQRRRSHAASATDTTAPITHARLVLQGFLDQRNFAELLLYHRGDPSPVGQTLRKIMADLRADLVADAWTLAQGLGIPARSYPQVAIRAETLFACVMAAGESLLEGRCQDLDLLAREIAALTELIIQNSLGPGSDLRV